MTLYQLYTKISPIAQSYNVNPKDIFNDNRHAHIVTLRYIIIYILYYDLQLNYYQIAELMSKDRSTIVYAVQETQYRINNWNNYKSIYNNIHKFLTNTNII